MSVSDWHWTQVGALIYNVLLSVFMLVSYAYARWYWLRQYAKVGAAPPLQATEELPPKGTLILSSIYWRWRFLPFGLDTAHVGRNNAIVLQQRRNRGLWVFSHATHSVTVISDASKVCAQCGTVRARTCVKR